MPRGNKGRRPPVPTSRGNSAWKRRKTCRPGSLPIQPQAPPDRLPSLAGCRSGHPPAYRARRPPSAKGADQHGAPRRHSARYFEAAIPPCRSFQQRLHRPHRPAAFPAHTTSRVRVRPPPSSAAARRARRRAADSPGAPGSARPRAVVHSAPRHPPPCPGAVPPPRCTKNPPRHSAPKVPRRSPAAAPRSPRPLSAPRRRQWQPPAICRKK